MIDCHVHTRWSGDSSETIPNVCRAAIEKGLHEICFTEHVDFEPTDYSYGAFDYEICRREIDNARAEFSGRLNIGFGIEVDYQARFHSQIRDFLKGKEFDYILGSAHYVDGVILEDHSVYFPGKDAVSAYAPYFDNVLAAAETGWFDALAHLDICKRHGVRYLGPFDPTPFMDRIGTILQAVIKREMSLEINTSGLRQSPKETYPAIELLRLYRKLGGRHIVVGSDSHKACDVGAGIEAALQLATDVGFDSVNTFRARSRKAISLG